MVPSVKYKTLGFFLNICLNLDVLSEWSSLRYVFIVIYRGRSDLLEKLLFVGRIEVLDFRRVGSVRDPELPDHPQDVAEVVSVSVGLRHLPKQALLRVILRVPADHPRLPRRLVCFPWLPAHHLHLQLFSEVGRGELQVRFFVTTLIAE